MEPKEVAPPWPRWVVATLGLWSVGIALLLVAFASVSIWYDELSSIHLAVKDTGRWKSAMYGGEVNGATFHVTLRFLVEWFGDDLLVIRAPSILAWTAGVPCFFALARRLAPAWPALAATAAYSLMPLGLHHGREARMYAFVATGTVVASLALTRYVERPAWPRSLSYGLAAGFALASQFTAVFVVVAHALAIVAHPDRGRLLRRCWPGLPGVVVGLVPLAIVFGRDGSSHVSWIPQRGIEETRAIIGTLMGLRRDPDWPLEPLLMLPALALVVAGVVAAVRPRRPARSPAHADAQAATPKDRLDDPDPWLRRMVALWALVPIVGLLAFSLLVSPLFHQRYLIVALPATVLLALSGLAWLAARLEPERQRILWALAGMALAAMIPGVVAALANPLYDEDYRAAGRAVVARLDPGDLVLAADSSDGQLGARGLLYHLGSDDEAALEPVLLTLRQFEDPTFAPPAGTRVWVASRTFDDSRTQVAEALGRLGMATEPTERWTVAHLTISLHLPPDR